MKQEPQAEARPILSRIVSRFLNLGAGTPIQHLRKSLGPQRHVLDQLTQGEYLKTSGNQYLPAFQAVEEQDADTRNIGRMLVGAVLTALRNLYRRHDKNSFTLAEIVIEAQNLDVLREEKEIVLGLILASDFDFFTSYAGPTTAGGELSMDNVSVKESILDFSSVEEAWQRVLSEREAARQRWTAKETKHPGFVSRVEQSDVEFAFMRNKDLRKVAERDYRELKAIADRPAWKARLVLVGGILEALLLDALLSRQAEARRKCRPSERNRPLEGWYLETLISVAVKLGIIKEDACRFTDAVRDYRNLVHPAREMQSKLRLGESQARIATEVLKIVIEDLQGPKYLSPTPPGSENE